MTDEPHLPRFLVRRGAKRDWMVWDKASQRPGKVCQFAIASPALSRNKWRSFSLFPAAQFGVGIIAMQRRPNWKPVIVASGHRAENGKIGKGETISHAAEVFTWVNGPTGGEDRLGDIRFTIGAALVLGLPALIGAGLYLAVTIALRLS
jgi:hypothetical protein